LRCCVGRWKFLQRGLALCLRLELGTCFVLDADQRGNCNRS
jgi:hypothetical protein